MHTHQNNTEASLDQERRHRRSDDPSTAVDFQLAHVIREFGLDCAVIADEGGRVISAQPASSPLLRSFSALLPAMAMLPASRQVHLQRLRDHRPDLSDNEVTCCVFRAGGQRLFIGALGPEAVMNEVAIFRAIVGTRRIHGS